jgi:hypothetical protein
MCGLSEGPAAGQAAREAKGFHETLQRQRKDSGSSKMEKLVRN